MPKLRSFFNRFIVVFMALQILNLSIYNTDFYDHTNYSQRKEALSNPNPIDCFAEMVFEDMAGISNAFPETNQKDGKQKGDLKSNLVFKIIRENKFAEIPIKQTVFYTSSDKEFSAFRNDYSYLFYKEINHPPA